MKRPRLRLAGLLLVLAASLAPATARAETETHLRGLLDLGLISSLQGRELNRLTFGDSNFDPYRLRLFLDAKLAPGFEVHVQTLLHEGLGPVRADGAYALWTPWPARDLSLEAGKIPWPIGTYAPRTYSDKSWLIGTPLMYQYRTALQWDVLALTPDAVVANAGAAQLQPNVLFLPVIDERWWDTGAALLGSFTPLEFSAGVVQGSPSWPAPGVDNTPGQTLLGRVGLVPLPGVRLGVSAADGNWMPPWFADSLPANRTLRDYRESTIMADLELARGPFELRGEVVRRRWATILTGDLDVDGGYAEARWSLGCGAWLAVRGEALRFSDVTTTGLVRRPWDDDVDRWEGVVGYRVTRDVRLKLDGQRTIRHRFEAPRLEDNLFSVGLSIRF
jgi:hypothetical protein